MGSGQGKTRRALTSAQSGPPYTRFVTHQLENWDRFVEESEIGDVTIDEYYLRHKPCKPTEEEHEKVMAELFADLVATGALVLPGACKVDDFQFTFRAAIDKDMQDGVQLTLKSEPELKPQWSLIPYYLAGAKMASMDTYVIKWLVLSIDTLLTTQKYNY